MTLRRRTSRKHVELGYATTVHAAQGSTADVMHGILTGSEDRQLLYTMLTRGRDENHLHLVARPTEGDEGRAVPSRIDEHLTAVETLDRIVDRDGAALSATTELAQPDQPRGPAPRSSAAVQRRRHHRDPTTHRAPMPTEALASADGGPLPVAAGIPVEVREQPQWSSYLIARADRVTPSPTRSAETPPATVAGIASTTSSPPSSATRSAVWRAANGVPDADRSLLGSRRPAHRDLAARLATPGTSSVEVNDLYPPSVRCWEDRIANVDRSPSAT